MNNFSEKFSKQISQNQLKYSTLIDKAKKAIQLQLIKMMVMN